MGVISEPFPSYGIVIIVLGSLLMIVSVSTIVVYRWSIATMHDAIQQTCLDDEKSVN